MNETTSICFTYHDKRSGEILTELKEAYAHQIYLLIMVLQKTLKHNKLYIMELAQNTFKDVQEDELKKDWADKLGMLIPPAHPTEYIELLDYDFRQTEIINPSFIFYISETVWDKYFCKK